MAQIYKGVRVMLQLRNSPEALVEHVNEVAAGAGLRVSPYLCAFFERVHGFEITEKAVPLQLVEVPPLAKRKAASELAHAGDGTEMLASRVPAALAEHMSLVAKAQGFPTRASYAYALVARAHGFPAQPVEAWHRNDPRFMQLPTLERTGA
jgi:hypothetical protein